MGTALSSWKEIAQYVGKGVRTVQRWEREAGLPVRRPQGEGKGKVLAFPTEIDGWMHSAFTRNGNDDEDSDVSSLRARVEQLLAENQELRRQLHAVSRSFPSAVGSNGSTDESLLGRCDRLLQESARTRQQFAQLVATQSVVTQACADTMQTLKSVHVFQPEDNHFHDAD
jgi:hypothetical protein